MASSARRRIQSLGRAQGTITVGFSAATKKISAVFGEARSHVKVK